MIVLVLLVLVLVLELNTYSIEGMHMLLVEARRNNNHEHQRDHEKQITRRQTRHVEVKLSVVLLWRSAGQYIVGPLFSSLARSTYALY
jgi:uncharacterized membrane protein